MLTSTAGTGSDADKYRQLVLGEILDHSPGVRWQDVVGLETAKQALQEAVVLPALRADIFQVGAIHCACTEGARNVGAGRCGAGDRQAGRWVPLILTAQRALATQERT